MTLWACVPLCYTFGALVLLILIVLGFGLAKVPPGAPRAADADADAGAHVRGPTGPPPLWVPVAFVVFLCALMAVLAWYWPE